MEIRGLSGIHQGRTIPVNGSVVIGRNQQSCTIVYPDNTKGISRLHCRVDSGSGGGTLTDLGSSYGTFLNGRKLPPNVPTPIHDGDTFYVGDSKNVFTVSGVGNNGNSSGSSSKQAKKGISKNALIGIIAAAAAVVIIAAVLIISNISAAKKDTLIGTTWRVAESPGMRMSFAENGDLLITDQGEFEINGSFTYSPAGDHMISVKYTAPAETNGYSVGGDLSFFDFIGGNLSGSETVTTLYSSGYVWKYKYDKKNDSMQISDVNDFKLFTLER